MTNRSFCKLAIAIGLGNYLVYVVSTLSMGGDALLGHVVRGHYFLAAQGAFIEASRSLFLFSKWQAYSLLITFPLGLLGARLFTPVQREMDGPEFGGNRNARLSPHTA